MKLFLDTCVSGRAVLQLRSAGHDVVWAGEWPEDPGDEEILERAHLENRVLVTLDKDFGELAIVYDRPHSGIVRLVDFRGKDQRREAMNLDKKTFHFTAIFEKEADGGYHVYCPALKGCHTQGDTYEESLRNIREAAALYIESLLDDHQPIPEEDVMIQPLSIAV